MTSWRKSLYWLTAIGIIGAASFYFARPYIIGVDVTPTIVKRDRIVRTIVASGRVETPARVNLGSQITGTVEEVMVAEGQRVQAGETLIRLHSEEADAALEQALASQRQAQAKIEQYERSVLPAAQQALEQALINQANATKFYDRTIRLAERGLTSDVALDEAKRTLDLATSQTRAAELAVASASPDGIDIALAIAGREQARAASQSARYKLELTRITAPANGTIIDRTVDPGMVVQPGSKLLELAPDGAKRLVVQIDERNLSLIRSGQAAIASADAYPDERFTAVIAAIMPAVDSERGSFEVKLSVDQPPDYLTEGMSVSVDIAIAHRDDALVLPVDAVRDLASDSPNVLVIRDGAAVLQPIKTGLRGDGMLEIIQGVAEGDQVVSTSDIAVKPGQRVTPVASGTSP